MNMLYAGSGMGFLLLGFTFIGTARGRKFMLLIAVTAILTGTTLVGCGSGSISTSPAGSAEVSQQVSGLKTAATYYWKVIASDGNGGTAESDVYSFTTK